MVRSGQSDTHRPTFKGTESEHANKLAAIGERNLHRCSILCDECERSLLWTVTGDHCLSVPTVVVGWHRPTVGRLTPRLQCCSSLSLGI